MKKKTIVRLIVDVLLVICVMNAWWFIAIPLVILGIWFFRYFFEAFIAGLAYDSLFGFVPGMGVFAYAGTIISVALLAIVEWTKGLLRR